MQGFFILHIQNQTLTLSGTVCTKDEYQQIKHWLQQRPYSTVGALHFLAQTNDPASGWKLIRQYNKEKKVILSVVVLRHNGTCFLVIDENKQTIKVEMFTSITAIQPRWIMTSGDGHALLHAIRHPAMKIVTAYDQWVMVCQQTCAEAKGSFATPNDIVHLEQYQQQYNVERHVNEMPNWQQMIAQQKV